MKKNNWTVRGSTSGGGAEIFRTNRDRPSGQPSFLCSGYLVFFPGGGGGVKRPGRDVDHPPPQLAARLKKE
jgi:hypothetical protein